jgi:hypothetical protein
MKKVLMGVLIVGVVMAVAAAPARSQDKKVNLNLNAGVQTNLSDLAFPQTSAFGKAWLTVDARLGVSLGKSMEISPEVMAVLDWGWGWGGLDTDEGGLLLYPGVLLNFRSQRFFAGAGVVLPIEISDGAETGDVAAKINAGYRSGHFQATAFFVAWNEHDFLGSGITLGYRF